MSLLLSMLNKMMGYLCKGLNYIAVVVTFLMSLWIFADVVGRYLFSHPIAGTTELVKSMIIIIVFLSIPYAWQQKRHIQTTLVLDRLTPKARTSLEILIYLLGIGVFACAVIYSWNAALQSWSLNEFDGDELRVPVYPSRFIVVIGAGLLVIQLVLDLVQCLRVLIKRQNLS